MDDPITSLVISPGPDRPWGDIPSTPLSPLAGGAALPTDLLESISRQRVGSSNHFFEPPRWTVQIWSEMCDCQRSCDALWIRKLEPGRLAVKSESVGVRFGGTSFCVTLQRLASDPLQLSHLAQCQVQGRFSFHARHSLLVKFQVVSECLRAHCNTTGRPGLLIFFHISSESKSVQWKFDGEPSDSLDCPPYSTRWHENEMCS